MPESDARSVAYSVSTAFLSSSSNAALRPRRQMARGTRGRVEAYSQTPSTGLRHPSFGRRCRKAMLGVWLIQCPRLSFLLLLMLLYVHGDRWLGEQGDELRLTHKLQALVYDILPLEEGAGKRCSECGLFSVHGFPFFFF